MSSIKASNCSPIYIIFDLIRFHLDLQSKSWAAKGSLRAQKRAWLDTVLASIRELSQQHKWKCLRFFQFEWVRYLQQLNVKPPRNTREAFKHLRSICSICTLSEFLHPNKHLHLNLLKAKWYLINSFKGVQGDYLFTLGVIILSYFLRSPKISQY